MSENAWSRTSLVRLVHTAVGAAVGRCGLSLVGRTAVLCGVLVFVTPAVWAQDPATSFDQLNLVLGKGDKITLVDLSGKEITGRVDRLGLDGLDLKTGGKIQAVSEKDIRRITREKPDSPLNGFLIGAGIGFGATLPIYLSLADSDETGLAVAASALWGLIGGGIGALTDAFIHEKQLVYFRPKSSVSWSVSPFYFDSPPIPQMPGAHALVADSPLCTGGKSSKGLRVTIRC